MLAALTGGVCPRCCVVILAFGWLAGCNGWAAPAGVLPNRLLTKVLMTMMV